MPTSPRWGIRYPAGTDAPDVPLWMERMATDLDDVAKDDQGLLANRPVSTVQNPGKRGRYYFATDTRQLFRDNGTGWDEIPIGGGYSVGDLKYSVQAANHGLQSNGLYAWLRADGQEVPSGYTALISLLQDAGNPFGVGPNGLPRLPDFRGRVPVAPGPAAGVSSLGDSDGLEDAAWRKVRHRHGRGTLGILGAGSHTHSVNDPGHNHPLAFRGEPVVHTADPSYPVTGLYGPGSRDATGHLSDGGKTFNRTTGISIQPSGIHSHEVTGFVGDTSGPLDGPAYLVGGRWFIKT